MFGVGAKANHFFRRANELVNVGRCPEYLQSLLDIWPDALTCHLYKPHFHTLIVALFRSFLSHAGPCTGIYQSPALLFHFHFTLPQQTLCTSKRSTGMCMQY